MEKEPHYGEVHTRGDPESTDPEGRIGDNRLSSPSSRPTVTGDLETVDLPYSWGKPTEDGKGWVRQTEN